MPSRKKKYTKKNTSSSSSSFSNNGGNNNNNGDALSATESAVSSLSSLTPPPPTNSNTTAAPVERGIEVEEEEEASSSSYSFPSPPSGFRLGGSAKELHGHPIYCVSWSSDLYEEQIIKSSPSKNVTSSSSSSSVKKVEDKLPPLPKQRRMFSCLATCGGNHATIYEIEAASSTTTTTTPKKTDYNNPTTTPSSQTNPSFSSDTPPPPPPPPPPSVAAAHPTTTTTNTTTSSSSSGGLVLRQAYRDADQDEIFYACAFGGRSIGNDFGYGPAPVANEDEEEVTLLEEPLQKTQEKEEEEEHKKKRKRTNTKEEKDKSNNPSSSSSLYTNLINLSSYNGPQLLCIAGQRGIIKVIDTVRRTLLLTLSGHGDEIYDMKFSPVDEWLLVTASKDESLRLWNVETATCVAIFAGHEGHRDAVLSVAWHPMGTKFASAGMDTTVKLWSLEERTVVEAIEGSYGVKAREWGGLPGVAHVAAQHHHQPQQPQQQDYHHPPPPQQEEKKRMLEKPFSTIYEQMPIFSTNKVHTDYVDCVQFVGDLILSKSITDTIVLWKPDLTSPRNNNITKNNHNGDTNNNNNNNQSHQRLPNTVIPLREFSLNHCDVWFIRFSTDADCRMLAIGNNRGAIKVWKIDTESSLPLLSSQGGRKTKKVGGYFASLCNQFCCSTVRMVSFSPDGRSFVATCDDSTVWKWDALD